MSTVSMQLPSASCKRYLTVPSLDCWRRRMVGAARVQFCSRVWITGLGWSVMAEKSVTSFWSHPFEDLFGPERRLAQPLDVFGQTGQVRSVRHTGRGPSIVPPLFIIPCSGHFWVTNGCKIYENFTADVPKPPQRSRQNRPFRAETGYRSRYPWPEAAKFRAQQR